MKIINAPKLIPMVNDLGGYVKISANYLWIKFSDESEKLEYRVEAVALLDKFRYFTFIKPCKGVKFFIKEGIEEEKILMIELNRPKKTNFRAEVVLVEFMQELYYIKSIS